MIKLVPMTESEFQDYVTPAMVGYLVVGPS